ncbi:MAG TPA: c-type cytochrome [Pyrinomonadaceae bacterium]|nr:c-type cytochrome [Pyrinomonadaceae bacterium]
MKQTRLKLSALALILTAGGIGFINRGHAQQPPLQQGDKPVEQTRKNIKVLNGLPDSQLIPVMQFISSSLGVDCAYCHTPPQFEKDDKPTKTIARQMIQMQLAINRDNKAIFGDTGAVTCYTCHRGQTEPQLMPKLPHMEQPSAGQSEAKPSTEPLPTVDQVLARYAQAMGGEAAFKKLSSRVMKGMQTGADGNSVPFETYQVAPDKLYTVLTSKQGPMMTGYNGTIGWQKGPRGQRQMAGGQLEGMRQAADFYSDFKLKEIYPNLTVAGREKIGDRETVVLVSKPSSSRTHKLYFDAQTGLLVRILNILNTIIAPVPSQLDFEDYRDVDGVKLPFIIRSSPVEAHDAWTRKFTEIKHNVTVDDAKFNPPPAPAPVAAPK